LENANALDFSFVLFSRALSLPIDIGYSPVLHCLGLVRSSLV